MMHSHPAAYEPRTYKSKVWLTHNLELVRIILRANVDHGGFDVLYETAYHHYGQPPSAKRLRSILDLDSLLESNTVLPVGDIIRQYSSTLLDTGDLDLADLVSSLACRTLSWYNQRDDSRENELRRTEVRLLNTLLVFRLADLDFDLNASTPTPHRKD